MAYEKVSYNAEYNKQNYCRISCFIPKDKQDDLKALAKREGLSVNGLFKVAILKAYGLDLTK